MIVAGKDVGEVDVDYFLIPVNIRDHEGPLRCSFPVENRLLPQGGLLQKSFNPLKIICAVIWFLALKAAMHSFSIEFSTELKSV